MGAFWRLGDPASRGQPGSAHGKPAVIGRQNRLWLPASLRLMKDAVLPRLVKCEHGVLCQDRLVFVPRDSRSPKISG